MLTLIMWLVNWWMKRRPQHKVHLHFYYKGLDPMNVTLGSNEDAIFGVRVTATRKGLPWPVPAGLTVVSSDTSVASVALDTDGTFTVSRTPSDVAGIATLVASAGALSASVDVLVEAAQADAIAFDVSDIVAG